MVPWPERNVISGNFGSGIEISGGASGNLVKGNFIGVNAAGTADLGNTLDGVNIVGLGGNIVGGNRGRDAQRYLGQ